MPRIVALCLILILCANQFAFAADKTPRQVQWSGLPALIEGRKFEAELTNGVRIHGKGAKITGQEMEINVIETSDATLVPLGPNRLPAQHFDLIKIHRRSVGRRIAFGVLLGLAGAGLSVFTVAAEWLGESVNGNDKGVLMLPIVFGAVGGVFLGGRRPVTVLVLHETEQDVESKVDSSVRPEIER